MSSQCLKKYVRDEVDFLHTDKHQSSLQVDLSTSSMKGSYKVILSLLMGMIKHSESTENKLRMVFIFFSFSLSFFFRPDKHQSFYKLALSFLMKVTRHVRSTQNRKRSQRTGVEDMGGCAP